MVNPALPSFGLFCLAPYRDAAKPQAAQLAEVCADAERAEALGFEALWIAEHHFSNYSLCPSPLVFAAHLAARTRRIRLGTGVLVLPLYDPVRLVEEIAFVDQLSGGRLWLGVGSGYQPFEFARFGKRLEDSVAVFFETLAILERGLGEGRLEHQGAHFSLAPAPLCLRPAQTPHPPIFVAGLSRDPEVVARIARAGYTPFLTPGWGPTAAVAPAREAFDRAWAEAGQAGPAPFAIQRYVYVTDDRADALEAAEHMRYTGRLTRSLRFGYEALEGAMLRELAAEDEPSLERICADAVVGDAETCAERLAADIALVRPTHYSCFMRFGAMEAARVHRSMEAFATRVVPLVREALAG